MVITKYINSIFLVFLSMMFALGFRVVSKRNAFSKVFDGRRYLNRIMFEPWEVVVENRKCYCKLNSSDKRFEHLKKILKVNDGDAIRVGIVDAGRQMFATQSAKVDKKAIP
mmetsp:Transcript_9402/g.14177  ORF Transcript_9402/g.14177 Transcript_9402/m.14177 type:complete len:111 (+) Transcript_9402:36-368(+)